jgi:hypothetical protein
MKHAVAFSFLLACGGVLLADSPGGIPSRDSRSLLQDLVQMTNAGLSDETILVYAKAHRLELPPEVSTADLVWLRKSGVGEPVIRYMAAVDVRSEDGGAGQDADDSDDAYDSDEAVRYSARHDSHSDGGYGNYRDSGDYSYPESYADNDYDSYPETYYNDYYPIYDAGFYPYPAYFFVNGGFLGRFRGRGFGHGFVGRRGRGFDRGGFGRQRFSRGDFDRSRRTRGDFDRSFGTRRGSVTLRRGGPGRPAFVPRRFDQGFRGSRGDVIGRGVPAQRAFSRGGFSPGPRAPRGPVVRNGGFGRPGFSGGGHAGGFGRPGFAGGGHSGGSGGRGPVARSGGGRGSVGGHGRH